MTMKWWRVAAAMILAWAMTIGGSGLAAAQTKPEGEMRWALYVTLAPAWFDPGESVVGVITPFWVLYGFTWGMFPAMT